MIVLGYYGFTLDVRVSVRPLVIHLFVSFSFPDDTLSKLQWIFTKLGMCIDIVEIWFGIADGQILSNFYGVIFPRQMVGYYSLMFFFIPICGEGWVGKGGGCILFSCLFVIPSIRPTIMF